MQDEMGILREVGSIAAAHGSIALSRILGKKINLSFPSTDIISCRGIPTKINVDKLGIAVISDLITGLNGKVLFLLDEKNAFKMIDLSYKIKEEDKKSGTLTEIGMSLIKEVGSIVTGANITALSTLLKRPILSLPPTLISGTIGQILNIILSAYKDEDSALFIEAAFEEPQEHISGGFYLLLSPEAAADIKQICKEGLKELGNTL